ncbi:FCD domain-containing protein [Mesorhizobium sp. B2-7-1]|uniref:FadR/GntR family transcriptional regulator n=1 Tax=Mesorhizobium sp. B2-7-1 TaxID=2589909 RepID=UPI00112DC871|nr:FCD domain-containing protein [Mesorhizobium sp. B2-7-1]TPJ57981.1 FadR family transcriptional regulator [Mesorhizobium sp. B2-7-1]
MLKIEKLSVPPAYQVVSNELRRHILAGSLRPGDPLPSEVELAARFGVNRSTVREGIRQLESDGLVRREGRKRLLVTIPDHSDLTPRTTRALVMRAVTFGELWDVSRVLEPLAARLAAENISEAELDALKQNLAATKQAVEQGQSPGILDLEFHTLLSEAAHNHALLLCREPVGRLLYPAFEQIQPQLPQAAGRLIKAHTEIVEALERRDPRHAELWAAKHIEDLKRGWLMAKLPLDNQIDRSLTS